MVRCGSKYGHQKDVYLKKDWTMYSKNVNHSKLSSQHNWGGTYSIWPLNERKNLHYDNE